jgi:hypothetical protein
MSENDREFYTSVWRCLIAFVRAFAKWQGFYIDIKTTRSKT